MEEIKTNLEITETEFFKKLVEKLEDLFPKYKCKERGQALVLNAFANIIHNEIVEKEKKLQSVRDYIVAESLCSKGWTFERYLNTLSEKIDRDIKDEKK